MSYNFSKFKQRAESEIVDLMFAGEIKGFKNYKKLLSEEEITEEYNKMTEKIQMTEEQHPEFNK